MCPGRSVLNRLCSPHRLLQSPKVGAGRGGGGSKPYCHANAVLLDRRIALSCKRLLALPLFEGGNAVHFFLVFLWLARCPLPFFTVFLLGSLFGIHVWERTFAFEHRCWSCFCFRWCFCLGFCSMSRRFAPEDVLKNSLHVKFSVLGSFSLFLRC